MAPAVIEGRVRKPRFGMGIEPGRDGPLALRVQQMRAALGVSQAELAKVAQIAEATVRRIEHGHTPTPTPDILRRLANGFGIHPIDKDFDAARANAYFHRFMQDAGYRPADPPPPNAPQKTWQEREAEIREVAARLKQLLGE